MVLKEADWYLRRDCILVALKVTKVDLHYSTTLTEASCPGNPRQAGVVHGEKDSAERYHKFKTNFQRPTGFAQEGRKVGPAESRGSRL